MVKKANTRTLAELNEFTTALKLQRKVIAKNATAMVEAKELAKKTAQTYTESQTKLGEIVDEFNRILPLFDGNEPQE